VGRYWTKAERKQHVRRRRQQQQHQHHNQSSPQQPADTLPVSGAATSGVALPNSASGAPVSGALVSGAADDAVDSRRQGTSKAQRSKKQNDFTAVQELLAQGGRPSGNRALGLLSVTTV